MRALHSGSYRNRLRGGDQREDREESELREEIAEYTPLDRPYFEVLMVDAMTHAQQDQQRQALGRMRKPTTTSSTRRWSCRASRTR